MAASSASSSTLKTRYYATYLRTELLPALQNIRLQLIQLRTDIEEYETLATRLKLVSEKNGKSGKGDHREETLVEFGSDIWVNAQIPDTRIITLDIGLDIYLDLPIQSAITYTEKRIVFLKRKLGRIQSKESEMVWQIEQFQSAIGQNGSGIDVPIGRAELSV